MNEQTESTINLSINSSNLTEREILLKKKRFYLNMQENNRTLISKMMDDLDDQRNHQSQLTIGIRDINSKLHNLMIINRNP